MDKRHRVIAAAALIILIIGAGLLAGYALYGGSSEKRADSSLSEVASSAPKAQPSLRAGQYEPRAVEQGVYIASPPSQGIALKTSRSLVLSTGIGSAVAFPDAKTAAEIKPGQRVLLYGRGGRLLDILGEVEKVNEGSGDFDKVHAVQITIDETADIPASMAETGRIVLARRGDAKRLPVSALSLGPDMKPGVWRIDPANGTVTREIIQPALFYADFFMMPDASTNYHYILNPDENLAEGKIVPFEKDLYWGLEEADDVRIQAMRNREDEARMAAFMAKQEPPPGYSANCPVSCTLPGGDTPENFIDKIRRMAGENPAAQ